MMFTIFSTIAPVNTPTTTSSLNLSQTLSNKSLLRRTPSSKVPSALPLPATGGGVNYYVSPTGSDANDGLSPSKAFKTPQKAADSTKPGDTVYFLEGTYFPEKNWVVMHIKKSGKPNAWITYKPYPNHRVKLKQDPKKGSWHIIYSDRASYINIEGLELEGNNQKITLKYARSQSKNKRNTLTNGNCLSVDGRKVPPKLKPHHWRVFNNKVHDCAGMGIGFAHADYITVDQNEIYNNSWFTLYGTSGTGTYQSYNLDNNTTDYKIIFTNNRVYNNRLYIPWIAVGKITDGNGILIDDGRHTQNGSKLGAYKGKTLVTNNILYNNGGSGVHAYYSDNVDIINNTAVNNNQSAEITGGQIFANQASNIKVLNNIMVAFPGKNVNANWTTRKEQKTNVFDYNIYWNLGKLQPRVKGKNDIVADPQFVNLRNFDFSLKNNSPAINTGLKKATVAFDYFKKTRIINCKRNRGAIEFGSLTLSFKPKTNTCSI
jgi:hypothetical protein